MRFVQGIRQGQGHAHSKVRNLCDLHKVGQWTLRTAEFAWVTDIGVQPRLTRCGISPREFVYIEVVKTAPKKC